MQPHPYIKSYWSQPRLGGRQHQTAISIGDYQFSEAESTGCAAVLQQEKVSPEGQEIIWG